MRLSLYRVQFVSGGSGTKLFVVISELNKRHKSMWTSDHHTRMWFITKRLHQLYWMLCCSFIISFTGAKRHRHYYNASVYHINVVDTWLIEVGVKEHEYPGFNPIRRRLGTPRALECQLHHKVSSPSLQALMPLWLNDQDTLENLVSPRRMQVIIILNVMFKKHV